MIEHIGADARGYTVDLMEAIALPLTLLVALAFAAGTILWLFVFTVLVS